MQWCPSSSGQTRSPSPGRWDYRPPTTAIPAACLRRPSPFHLGPVCLMTFEWSHGRHTGGGKWWPCNRSPDPRFRDWCSLLPFGILGNLGSPELPSPPLGMERLSLDSSQGRCGPGCAAPGPPRGSKCEAGIWPVSHHTGRGKWCWPTGALVSSRSGLCSVTGTRGLQVEPLHIWIGPSPIVSWAG
jgi:hypothetical protein